MVLYDADADIVVAFVPCINSLLCMRCMPVARVRVCALDEAGAVWARWWTKRPWLINASRKTRARLHRSECTALKRLAKTKNRAKFNIMLSHRRTYTHTHYAKPSTQHMHNAGPLLLCPCLYLVSPLPPFSPWPPPHIPTPHMCCCSFAEAHYPQSRTQSWMGGGEKRKHVEDEPRWLMRCSGYSSATGYCVLLLLLPFLLLRCLSAPLSCLRPALLSLLLFCSVWLLLLLLSLLWLMSPPVMLAKSMYFFFLLFCCSLNFYTSLLCVLHVAFTVSLLTLDVAMPFYGNTNMSVEHTNTHTQILASTPNNECSNECVLALVWMKKKRRSWTFIAYFFLWIQQEQKRISRWGYSLPLYHSFFALQV